MYAQSGGRSEVSVIVPVSAAKITSSSTCSANAMTCDTPTLAAASAGDTLDWRR